VPDFTRRYIAAGECRQIALVNVIRRSFIIAIHCINARLISATVGTATAIGLVGLSVYMYAMVLSRLCFSTTVVHCHDAQSDIPGLWGWCSYPLFGRRVKYSWLFYLICLCRWLCLSFSLANRCAALVRSVFQCRYALRTGR